MLEAQLDYLVRGIQDLYTTRCGGLEKLVSTGMGNVMPPVDQILKTLGASFGDFEEAGPRRSSDSPTGTEEDENNVRVVRWTSADFDPSQGVRPAPKDEDWPALEDDWPTTFYDPQLSTVYPAGSNLEPALPSALPCMVWFPVTSMDEGTMLPDICFDDNERFVI